MAIFHNINDLPAFRNAVVTIGTFDGVHTGHKTILQQVVNRATEVDGESVLITFEPHPRKLLFPSQPLKLLTPLEDKLQLLLDAGIDHIVVAPFTASFSQLSAADYINDFLVAYFHPHTIIIGYDHHFGHDRKGDIALLQQYAPTGNYEVLEIPAHLIEEAAVSSTKIRNALNDGHVQDASHMLGRHYSIKGTVIKGRQLGRTIGYPTANIRPADPEQLIPGNGIYAVCVVCDGKKFKGMLSIGYNPTVTDEKRLHIEVNIFGFDANIYGHQIEVQFVAYLRSEVKFASLEALKDQLHQDRQNSLLLLENEVTPG